MLNAADTFFERKNERKQRMKIDRFPSCYFIAALFLLALPVIVQAQFIYVTNSDGNSITITGYNGPGGAVFIPNYINGYSVTVIGNGAFADSTNLTGVTTPTTAARIGEGAFAECERLNYVEIAGGVTNIGPEAFLLCTSLTSINIDSVTSIGSSAFSGCGSLANIVIPGSINSIGEDAFAMCTNLTTAYFQANAPPDNGTAFYGDPGAVVYYEPGTTGWGATFGGAPTDGETPSSEFGYITNDAAITIISCATSLKGVIAIPGAINGYPGVNIGARALNGAEDVTNVIIPNTVTNIGDDAFASIITLTNVTIPQSVTSIGMGAFEDCERLPRIMIPGSVTSIGEYAFFGCYKLTNITVDAANPSYSSLNGVLFDKAQETLITYPEARTNGAYTIPDSVTSIGQDAFSGFLSLTSAYFQGNTPAANGNVFNGSPATVYYLPGTTGCGSTFGGAPTKLWYQPQPQVLSFEPSFGLHNNKFGFTVSWATNTSIIVQACTNLTNPNWIPVATSGLTSGTSPFSDPQWKNYPNRFYRVSSP